MFTSDSDTLDIDHWLSEVIGRSIMIEGFHRERMVESRHDVS